MADELEQEQQETPDAEVIEKDAEATGTENPTGDSERAETAAGGEGSGVEGGGQPDKSWTNMREYAEKELGITGASQFAKDEEFAKALAAEWRREAQVAQERERELTYLRAQWQTQQQPKAETPKPDEKPKAWNPPEYDPRWDKLITEDAEGNRKVRPGSDPSILAKYDAYHDYRRAFVDRLTSNPDETLAPFIEQRAQTLVDKVLNERLTERENKQHAQQFIEANRNWLFDQQGQPTHANRRFQAHLAAAEKDYGITDYQRQIAFAHSQTELEFMREQQRQASSKDVGEQQKKAALEKGNRKPNRSGSTVGSAPGHTGAPQNTNGSLRDMLTRDLVAVSDDEINGSV